MSRGDSRNEHACLSTVDQQVAAVMLRTNRQRLRLLSLSCTTTTTVTIVYVYVYIHTHIL